LTHLFPNPVMPLNGIFLGNRLARLSGEDGVDLRVIAPVPWFPSSRDCFGRYAVFARVPGGGEWRGIPVSYPRVPVIPKVGMQVAPFLSALALIRPVALLRRTFDFDIIDSYMLYPDGVVASLLSTLFHRPYVMTALGSDVNVATLYRGPRACILEATRRAGGVTTVSDALRDKLVSLGAPPSKIRTIRHGVDRDCFHPPENRDSERAGLGMSLPTLVSAGHLIQLKGHDLAIRAMTMLPGMMLLIAGEGPEEHRLRQLIGELRLQDRVRLLGSVDQHRLSRIFGAADALVHCSASEGIPNVAVEAMACGTPVVATDVGGTGEVVREPAAGLLLGERTADAVAAGVTTLLENPPRRSDTRRYAERFDWHDTAAAHVALLRAALTDGCPRSGAVTSLQSRRHGVS
jgi:glycosyltransferase involved in cell wall biosynthesis